MSHISKYDQVNRHPQLPAGGEHQEHRVTLVDGCQESYTSETYPFDDRIDALDWRNVFDSDEQVTILLRPAGNGLRLVCATGSLGPCLEVADGENEDYVSLTLKTEQSSPGIRERRAVVMFDSTPRDEPGLGYVEAIELATFLQRHANPSTQLRLTDLDPSLDAFGVDELGSIYNGPLGEYGSSQRQAAS